MNRTIQRRIQQALTKMLVEFIFEVDPFWVVVVVKKFVYSVNEKRSYWCVQYVSSASIPWPKQYMGIF